MRRVSALIGPAVAGTVLLSGCSFSPEAVQPGEDGFSMSVSPDIREAFTDIDNYWEHTRGLGETGIKLVSVAENETFLCPEGSPVNGKDTSQAAYCRSNNTIGISQLGWDIHQKDYVEGGGTPADYNKPLLGHEYGHALRQVNNQRQGLVESDNTPIFTTEQQADCLDGLTMKSLHVIPVDALFKILGDGEVRSNSKDAHGSIGERKQAFFEGQSQTYGEELHCGLTALTNK